MLKKGLNFNISGGVKKEVFLASVEEGIELMNTSVAEKDLARLRIVSSLRNQSNFSNLDSKELIALKSLKNDPNIVIVPSDKGRCTVVMNSIDYESKSRDLLDDRSTYALINEDPTPKIERDIVKKLNQLKIESSITEDEFNRMRPKESLIPLFYGLPKTHKTDIPLRPIVSFINSPTYKIAKELSRRLRPLTLKSNHMIKNS